MDAATLTSEIIDWLRSELPGGHVGDNKAPDGHELLSTPSRPYWIVYSISGGSAEWTPSWLPFDTDVDVELQISSVGRSREHAQRAAGAARALFLALDASTGRPNAPAPPGWIVAMVEPESGPGGPIGEGSPPTEIWTVPERYVLRLTQS